MGVPLGNPSASILAGHRRLACVGFTPAGPRLFSYRFAQKPNIFLPVGRKKDIGESVVQPKWLLSEAVLSETVLVIDGCSNSCS
jgi:hypothetical protein